MYVSLTIRDLKYLARSVIAHNVMVDPSADATWIARRTLERAGIGPVPGKDRTVTTTDGQLVTREVGFAMLEADPHLQTVDEVVFAEPDDVQRLGARALVGFNVTIDRAERRLVPAGPQSAPANYEQKSEN